MIAAQRRSAPTHGRPATPLTDIDRDAMGQLLPRWVARVLTDDAVVRLAAGRPESVARVIAPIEVWRRIWWQYPQLFDRADAGAPDPETVFGDFGDPELPNVLNEVVLDGEIEAVRWSDGVHRAALVVYGAGVRRRLIPSTNWDWPIFATAWATCSATVRTMERRHPMPVGVVCSPGWVRSDVPETWMTYRPGAQQQGCGCPGHRLGRVTASPKGLALAG
jgi:hypothetical protein